MKGDEYYMGKKFEIIPGQKFNKLTIIQEEPSPDKYRRVLCECECGKRKIIRLSDIRRGHTKSCGCYNSEVNSKRHESKFEGKTFGYLKVLERDRSYYGQGVKSHWFCLCTKCGNIKSFSAHSLSQSIISCGCVKSKGEEKIASILKAWNIKFITEYKFLDHKNRRYDFALLDKNDKVVRLIEFDGLQHYYQPRAKHWASTSPLKETQKRDLEKNQIAEEKGIPLIRIPYWHLDKISILNLLDDTYLVKKE